MMDMLTQVTIMDLVVKLTESPYGVKLMNQAKFIDNLFDKFGGQNEDSFGFLTSNMILVGAKLYSIDIELFNPFESENYMAMYKSYLCGPIDMNYPNRKDIALSSMYFLFI